MLYWAIPSPEKVRSNLFYADSTLPSRLCQTKPYIPNFIQLFIIVKWYVFFWEGWLKWVFPPKFRALYKTLSGINNVTLKEEKNIVRLTTGAKGKYFLQVLNGLFVSSHGSLWFTLQIIVGHPHAGPETHRECGNNVPRKAALWQEERGLSH